MPQAPTSDGFSLPPLPIESGDVLRDAHVSYVLDGVIAPRRDNVVLVLHALTGSPQGAIEWWRASVAARSHVLPEDRSPTRPEPRPEPRPPASPEPRQWAVLAPDLYSAFARADGSPGGSPDGSPEGAPAISTRDMARVVGVLLERLRIPRLALVAGGSLGGMVALEFVATFPGRARAAAVFVAPAAQGAAAIGWVHVQREALRATGNGPAGLALARQIAMLTYRSAQGLQQRFGRRAEGAAPRATEFAVQAWLRAHGERLTARFDAGRYLALIDAMDSHDVGRGRGGVGERLRASGTSLTGVGVPGDLFYPAEDVASWVAEAGGRYREIDSVHGHDAFLIEQAQVGAILEEALGGVRGAAGAPPVRDELRAVSA